MRLGWLFRRRPRHCVVASQVTLHRELYRFETQRSRMETLFQEFGVTSICIDDQQCLLVVLAGSIQPVQEALRQLQAQLEVRRSQPLTIDDDQDLARSIQGNHYLRLDDLPEPVIRAVRQLLEHTARITRQDDRSLSALVQTLCEHVGRQGE